MFKGILRGIFLACLLIQPTSTLPATADHFWLLQEYGIEKRSLADGSLTQKFASVYKPITFSIKPKQQGVWAVADGHLISFDVDGNILNTTPLENVNEHAYLVSMPETGVWLVHGTKRYAYNQDAELVATLELPTTGNRINDVAYDDKNKRMCLVTDNTMIAIDQDEVISQFKLKKNEKINGIATTKDGDIAIIIATPQPEFRLYSSSFELQTTHSFGNVSPAPDNLVETKDGKFWLVGKQHILLVDKTAGVIINREFNGDLPQGPGEIQLITDNADNSVWISIGRQLKHVSVTGDELHLREEIAKNIDVQQEPERGTPPEIRFRWLMSERFYNSQFNKSYFEEDIHKYTLVRYNPMATMGFQIVITDSEGDLDYTSFVVGLNDNYVTLQDIESSYISEKIFGSDQIDCRTSHWILLSSGTSSALWCDYIKYSPASEQLRQDEIIKFSVQISDLEGNESNVASRDIIFDTIPPVLNKDLVSLSIQGETATITGVAGSAEPGGYIGLLNTRKDSGNHPGERFYFPQTTQVSNDGSFTLIIPLIYGICVNNSWLNCINDTVELYHYDDADNLALPISYRLGYEIELSNLSPATTQMVGPSITLSGTHNMQSDGIISARYWTKVTGEANHVERNVEIQGNTFTLEDIVFAHDGINRIYLESKSPDGGYGYLELDFNVDRTPPPPIYAYDSGNELLIDIIENSIRLECVTGNANYYCAEPYSTVHITNTTNGEMISVQVDESGNFIANIPGSRGDLLEFYVEDSVGNIGTIKSYSAGKVYNDIKFVRAKHYINSALETFSYTLGNGSYVPSRILDEVYVDLGDSPHSIKYDLVINGVTAERIWGSQFYAKNVPLSHNDTITAIYRDPYEGYGEVSVTLLVDDVAPALPNLDLITITQYVNVVEVSGASGSIEPNSKVYISNISTGEGTYPVFATETGAFSQFIYAKPYEMLNIRAVDSVGNTGAALEIPTAYVINISITEPATNGSITYHDFETIKGYHDGPPGTYVRIGGLLADNMDGSTFSDNALLQPVNVIDEPSYTHSINVFATGPNNGSGYATVYFIKEVMPPNKDLINIVYGDGTVTLIGEANAVYPGDSLAIINSTTNYSTSIKSKADGSFTVIISAEKGDVLTLIAIDEDDYKQSTPITLELGYLVDLAIASPLNGTETLFQGLTVTGTHSGPATSSIIVNGISATVSEGSFIAENVTVPESGLIEVRLDDSDGAYATASVTVVPDITPPPTPDLALIDVAFSAGDSVRLRGLAGSVEAGAVLTITNTAQNVSTTVTVTVADDGSFSSTYIAANSGETLTLIATDAAGNQSALATQQLGNEVMITIDTPTAGASVPHNRVTVTGTHQGPINSGVVVNGVIAAVTANRFVALNVPVNANSTITATLSALDGSHGQVQISVMNLNQPVTLNLTPSSTEGVAPHTVNFEWSAAAKDAPTEISIDYDGDGIFDQTTVDPTLPLQHAYSTAAINNVTLRVTMPDGSVQTAETVIVTHAPDYIDAIFLSLWNGMNEALLANEPKVALNYLNLAGQSRFFVTFQVIAPGMQAIADSYRTPARGEINGSYLEYIVPRSIDGSNLLYFVYCMKEQDGTWRIDSM